jgi:signal transduction histidine kinase
MSPIKPKWRFGASCRRVLAGWIALCGLAAAANAGPIRTWSINFNDPAEPSRWQSQSPEALANQIEWKSVPRNASEPASAKVLQFSAMGGLGVESYFTLYRPFPPDFQPDPNNDLVVEWDWMIGDTEASDAITLSVFDYPCYGIVSHTRFTLGWPVLFVPADRWTHHRHSLLRDLCPEELGHPRHLAGLTLEFLSPVREVVSLASLIVEEWPRGSLKPEPLLLPHRPPPPERPFQEIPFARLQHATAGALEDLDGDGLPELLVLERQGYAHLYRGGGKVPFGEEITRQAGLATATMGTGAMFIDLDGDGDKDLIVTSEFGIPRFFENLGDLRFRERKVKSLDDRYLSFWYGAAADDVDRDGNVDLLFVSPLATHFLFLRNHGGWRLNIEPLFDPRALGEYQELNFSASFADVDEDGWPDFFLGRELLLRNSSGRFTLAPEPWKPVNRAQTEGGVWADLTGDGKLDLLILRDLTEGTKGPSRLLKGRGDGTFVDITSTSGLPPLESAEVALVEDFDNDGDLDLYLCQRNRAKYLMLNDGHGHFKDATEGSSFMEAGGCDAALAGDLNGDGAMDIIILRYGSPPAILYNRLKRGNWLGVVARGNPGSEAVGARVRILDPKSGKPILVRWVRRGQGFGPVGPAELRFGLGDRKVVDLEVRFPSGKTRLVKGARGGTTHLVSEEEEGFLATVRQHLDEALFPAVEAFRRLLSAHPAIAWLIAGLAFLVALTTAAKPSRATSLLLLAGGALLAAFLGSIPGRGLVGSPPALWAIGALVGISIPGAAVGFRRVAGVLRRRSRNSVLQREDLIRFTHDFRHAGIEARALLSIHGRAQNLFLSGEPHPPFLSALKELAATYPQATGERIRELFSLSQAAFPDLAESSRLEESERCLADLLGQLVRLGGETEPLSRWRDQLLLALKATEAALKALLNRLDLLCSCEIRDVLREACATQGEALRRAGVALRVEEGTGPLCALIVPESLLMILENLFTNALAAPEATKEPRIEIELRPTNQEIHLRFRDNGPGVPLEHAGKIFQYGFSTRSGGKGYGLARSREILGHFGGSMVLEPCKAPGASFLITLRTVSPA